MTGRRAKILIVDDVPSNIHVLSRILRSEHDIFFATSGAEGLRVAKEKMPDLVLLDIMMPGMDGYAVCARLKADPETADIPVIFVTALGQETDEERGLEAGAVDYVIKPFSMAVVRMRVKTHLELKRQRDLLHRLSLIDGLTGLANRRRFDEALAKEWRRCMRRGAPLTLVMLDIDLFKQYNDTWGHLGGDDCLRSVAEVLMSQLARPGDLAARYGGEEFVMLMPETDLDGGEAVAEKVRSALEALHIPHPASDVADHVTISIGVASTVPRNGTDPLRLVEAADRALYQAKKQGRNRVCAWTMPVLQDTSKADDGAASYPAARHRLQGSVTAPR